MNKSTKIAMAFFALAGVTATAAIAGEMKNRAMERGPGGMMFTMADADKSGDVTLEEFTAAINGRVEKSDADKDGKLTVAEVADAIMRQRAETAAGRIVARFDTDGDGALSQAEIADRQQKIFAFLDQNSDGKVAQDEMRGMRRHGMRDSGGHGWGKERHGMGRHGGWGMDDN